MKKYFVLYSVIILFATNATASTACPSGTSPATNADLSWMSWAGLPTTIGMCISKQDADTGKAVAEAKKWLYEHSKKENRFGDTSKEAFVKMQSQFAVCAQKFLAEYAKKYGEKSFIVSSAYRSYKTQQNICKSVKGPCGKPTPTNANGYPTNCSGHWHQCGLALDVAPRNGGSYTTLHAMSDQKRFGIQFPMKANDRMHIQPRKKATACGYGITKGNQIESSNAKIAENRTPDSSAIKDQTPNPADTALGQTPSVLQIGGAYQNPPKNPNESFIADADRTPILPNKDLDDMIANIRNDTQTPTVNTNIQTTEHLSTLGDRVVLYPNNTPPEDVTIIPSPPPYIADTFPNPSPTKYITNFTNLINLLAPFAKSLRI